MSSDSASAANEKGKLTEADKVFFASHSAPTESVDPKDCQKCGCRGKSCSDPEVLGKCCLSCLERFAVKWWETMNEQQAILVQRLREADLSLNRFLKVGKPNCPIDDDKKAFESEWQKKLYSPEDLVSYPRWGINGSDFLVLIDTDDQRLYDALNKVLPETFEVTSPRRGLPHKYYVVCGPQVENFDLYLKGVLDKDGKQLSLGEVRANNHYLVAPGTEIRFVDKQTSKAKTGMYTITKDIPITRLEYADFATLITPFLGSKPTQNLTIDQIENGIPEGERHTVLYQEACKFACAGVTEPFILDALRTTANRCKPPFTDEEELNRMVKNALKFKAEQDEKKRKLAEGIRLIEIIGSAKNKTAEEKLGEFLEADAEFKTVYEGNYKKYFGKRAKAEAYLVYTLLKSGFTVEETRKVMEGSKDGKWNSDKAEPEEREEYQDNAIEKAQNTIKRDAANPTQKRSEEPLEINPVVLAKEIKSNHIFIVEENSRQLYVYSEKDGYYQSHAEELIKTEIVKKLDEDARARYYQDVSFYIIAGAKVEPFDNHPELLVCQNGILDVVKRELQPFSPNSFINTKIPIVYDPDAKMPAGMKFLQEVIGEKQIKAFQEAVGHALYRRMLFNKATLFVGSGANGKTKLLAWIKALLGKDNVSALTLQDMCHNRFSLAVLYGKMANICGDLPSKKLEQTGGFKLGTGEDTIHAEIKNKMPFPFVNTAKIFFGCNVIPPISEAEDCHAFFRRWIILECNNVFEGKKADKRILEKITTPSELSGFLNFALKGLKRLMENNDFSVNETVEQLRKQYIKRSDSVKAFIEELVIVTNEYSDWIEIGELFKVFVRYCNKEKIGTVPQRVFTTDMKEHCAGAEYTVHRLTREEQERGDTSKKQIHVWSYIKLKNVTDVTDVIKSTIPAIPTLEEYSILQQQDSENLNYKDSSIAGIRSLITSVTSVTKQSSERTCGLCELNLKLGCTYPDGDYRLILPTNTYAQDCRDFTPKRGSQ